MANVFRPLNVTKPEPRSPFVAINSQSFLSPSILCTTLKGQDKFFGGPGNGPDYDWPNPKGPNEKTYWAAIHSQQDVWVNGIPCLYQIYDPTVFRPPLINKRESLYPDAAISSQIRVWQNCLLNTLSGPPAMPSGLVYDWPNPRAPQFSIGLRSFTDDLKIHLLGKDQMFGAAGQVPSYDWPNPMGAYTFLISNRTHIDPLKINLVGQDKMFGAAGQVPSYDWPNPRGPIGSVSLKSWLDPLKLNLLSQDKFFGAPGQPPPNYDWPNPSRGQQRLVSLSTFTQSTSIVLISLPVVLPFFNYDWPNPRGPLYPSDLRSFTNGVRLQLIGKDQFFGAPGQPPTYDWPNPRGPVFSNELRGFTQIQSIVLGGITLPPFIPIDFPNPIGRNFPVALRSWLEPLKLNLLGKDRFFGAAGQPPANTDWPVPKGRIFPVDLRGWSDQLKINLIGQDQFFGIPGQPPANNDWPVPRGRQYPSELLTFIDQVKRQLIGKDKFFGPAGMPPTYDYPNPRGRQYPVDLRSFIDPIKIQLIGQDMMYGQPGEVPSYDWTNPNGYHYPEFLRGDVNNFTIRQFVLTDIIARFILMAQWRQNTFKATWRQTTFVPTIEQVLCTPRTL